jgi:hypothetical protein
MIDPHTIATLRHSARSVPHCTIGGAALAAYIWLDPASREWTLVSHGQPVCSGPLEVLAELCRREAASKGYVARTLDPAIDPETAAIHDPVEFERRRSAIAREALAAREQREADKAAAERRASLIDVARLSFEDL